MSGLDRISKWAAVAYNDSSLTATYSEPSSLCLEKVMIAMNEITLAAHMDELLEWLFCDRVICLDKVGTKDNRGRFWTSILQMTVTSTLFEFRYVVTELDIDR